MQAIDVSTVTDQWKYWAHARLDVDLVVASPLYKQHYRLEDGTCLEDATLRLRTWAVRWVGDVVEIELQA